MQVQPTATESGNVEVGPRKITAYLEDDVDEFIGFIVMYSVGDVIIPRQWLLDTLRETESGLESYKPSQVTPLRAYKRALNRLLTPEFATTKVSSHPVQINMLEGDDYVRHIEARIFFGQEQIGEEGGRWTKVDLGRFKYDPNRETLRFYTDVSEDSNLNTHWNRIIGRMQGLHKEMQESHNGRDLRNLFRRVISDAKTVRFRDGVYFIGPHKEQLLRDLATIWEGVRDFKVGGRSCDILFTPVLDSDEQRGIIERKVRDEVEDMVDGVLDATFERLINDDALDAPNAARQIVQLLGDAEEFAAEYNQLLRAEISVERILQERMESLDAERESIVAQVLEPSGLEGY